MITLQRLKDALNSFPTLEESQCSLVPHKDIPHTYNIMHNGNSVGKITHDPVNKTISGNIGKYQFPFMRNITPEGFVGTNKFKNYLNAFKKQTSKSTSDIPVEPANKVKKRTSHTRPIKDKPKFSSDN